MNTRKTKAELLADNQRLGAENHDLRKQLSELRFKLAQQAVPAATRVYPLVDKIGRRYRVEVRGGRTIKCFAPGN